MSRYHGLDRALKIAVFTRDNWRCRWCGSTNRGGYDAHHIEYRRGSSYDRLDNLVTLCRGCHDFVHDSYQISKSTVQLILFELISGSGTTGLALWRQHKLEQERIVPPSSPGGRLLTGTAATGRLLKDLSRGQEEEAQDSDGR
jgi:hypothetical protein